PPPASPPPTPPTRSPRGFEAPRTLPLDATKRPPLLTRRPATRTAACRWTDTAEIGTRSATGLCGTLHRMAFNTIDRLIRRDPERRVLRALSERTKHLPPRPRPDDSLQAVVDLARELINGRYAALSVTDEYDHTEG